MSSLANAAPAYWCFKHPALFLVATFSFFTASYKSASILEATATNNCCPTCSTGFPYPDNTASSVIDTPLATFLTAISWVDSAISS